MFGIYIPPSLTVVKTLSTIAFCVFTSICFTNTLAFISPYIIFIILLYSINFKFNYKIIEKQTTKSYNKNISECSSTV